MWSKEVRERTYKHFGGNPEGQRIKIYVPTHEIVKHTGKIRAEKPMRVKSIYVKGENEKIKTTKTISFVETLKINEGKCKGTLKNGQPCNCKRSIGNFCKRHTPKSCS